MSTELAVHSHTDSWETVTNRISRYCQKEMYAFIEAGVGAHRRQVDDRLPDTWPGSTRRERCGGSQDTLHGLMRSLKNYLSTAKIDEAECKAEILWYSQEVVSKGQERITMKMSITVAGRTGYATVSSNPYAVDSPHSDRQTLFRPDDGLFLGEPTQSSSTRQDSDSLPMTAVEGVPGDISAHGSNDRQSVGHVMPDGVSLGTSWWENNSAFAGGPGESVWDIQTPGTIIPETTQAFSLESPREGSSSSQQPVVDPDLLKTVAVSTMTTLTYGPD